MKMSDSAQPHRDYADRVRSEICADLARAATFKPEFFRPRFSRLMMDARRGSERICAVMADLVAGAQSYRGLKWRLAKTMEFGLAWQMLSERSR
jgi:hypothetical protein